jgi:hypothetical protein
MMAMRLFIPLHEWRLHGDTPIYSETIFIRNSFQNLTSNSRVMLDIKKILLLFLSETIASTFFMEYKAMNSKC